jgi:hypothetical protein
LLADLAFGLTASFPVFPGRSHSLSSVFCERETRQVHKRASFQFMGLREFCHCRFFGIQSPTKKNSTAAVWSNEDNLTDMDLILMI